MCAMRNTIEPDAVASPNIQINTYTTKHMRENQSLARSTAAVQYAQPSRAHCQTLPIIIWVYIK